MEPIRVQSSDEWSERCDRCHETVPKEQKYLYIESGYPWGQPDIIICKNCVINCADEFNYDVVVS